MATQQTTQLVRLGEVADTIGAPAMFVANAAGKDAREWWTGEPAVTFAVAREIAERWAANVADATEKQRRYDAEQEAKLEREHEQYRREAAERAKRERTVLHGVETSFPGDPEPWAGLPSVEKE